MPGANQIIGLLRVGRRGSAGRAPKGQSPARGAPDLAPLDLNTARYGSAWPDGLTAAWSMASAVGRLPSLHFGVNGQVR
jgi:hypothetical protein